MWKKMKQWYNTTEDKLYKFLVLFLGILIPLFVFIISFDGLAPEYKSLADFGWFSVLVTTKMMLLPFALWAVIALFVVEIKESEKKQWWIAVGLWNGVVVALLSCISLFWADKDLFGIVLPYALATPLLIFFIYKKWLRTSIVYIALVGVIGVIFVWFEKNNYQYIWHTFFQVILLFLILGSPFFVLGWYSIAAYRYSKQYTSSMYKHMGVSALISLPFVVAAIVWAQKLYERLPENPPPGGCYVVTASQMYPKHQISYKQCIPINKQLIIIKAWEFYWERTFPRSHKFFRSVYDRQGPVIAEFIKRKKYRAQIMYIVLKPVEWCAHVMLHIVVRYGQNVSNFDA